MKSFRGDKHQKRVAKMMELDRKREDLRTEKRIYQLMKTLKENL
ncbi:hypothetical protein BD780_002366 [Clostridium tetanomorphum]|nr:hypothetical protein [Clostridium tetanomorphum]MBP1866162.1 hypothetical protein [Clostridium tetanomorphum]NRS85141.1 hypothetical protein [Clostridium tetanomorphum]NRZ98322.1 hypothetical protein [Clostridium tetanomorphum]SQC03155.1 Uncharacterised protein [Clostridium tetanomorphum]